MASQALLRCCTCYTVNVRAVTHEELVPVGCTSVAQTSFDVPGSRWTVEKGRQAKEPKCHDFQAQYASGNEYMAVALYVLAVFSPGQGNKCSRRHHLC